MAATSGPPVEDIVLILLKANPATLAGSFLVLESDGTVVLRTLAGSRYPQTSVTLLQLAGVLAEHPAAASFSPGWAAAIHALPYLPFTAHVPAANRPALALALLASNAFGLAPAAAREYSEEARSWGTDGAEPLTPSDFTAALQADESSPATHLFTSVPGKGWVRSLFDPRSRPPRFNGAWCEDCPATAHLGSCNARYGCRVQAEADAAWSLDTWFADADHRQAVARIRQNTRVFPPLEGPRPEGIVSDGIDALPPGSDPFGPFTVWFVTWPHGDGTGSPHPVVVLPCGEKGLLLLRVTSRVEKHARPGADVLLNDLHSAGLVRKPSSAVIGDAWCPADRASLSAHGTLIGRLSGDDARRVLATFRGCFDRWEGRYHTPKRRKTDR